ncbi:hypothetical protein Agabi119p4_8870 [Agaricus bisporus var. burnettii]|uniref:Uncharacterized protein n=1 Tax=Agaricus bisporus var. burnettii TaxID=192524 RepID=A0A8H7C4S9_AGABI|nr:hypothetical protein Agabi119p4_8870 [Agaricus bisporus var. burnettii]
MDTSCVGSSCINCQSGMDTRLSFIPRHFSQPSVSLYNSFPTFHSSRSLCPADTCNDKGFFRSAGATCPLIPQLRWPTLIGHHGRSPRMTLNLT